MRSFKAGLVVWFTICLVLIALAGSVVIVYASRWGIGIGYDSYKYMTAAQSLVHGHGLQTYISTRYEPLIHFPLLYPLALAPFLLFGLGMVRSVTLLGAILFGTTIFLVGFIVYRFSHQVGTALAAAFITCVSPIMIDVNLEAMSEPLFFIWQLIGLALLATFINNRRMRWLIAAAIVASLAYLTRYVGVTMIATGVIVLLLQTEIKFKSKLVDISIYLISSGLPIGVWSLRNYLAAGSLTNRRVNYHAINPGNLYQGWETIKTWFIPSQFVFDIFSGLFFIAAALVLIFSAWYWLRRGRNASTLIGMDQSSIARDLIFVMLIFSLTYILSLIASLTYIDAATKLNNRILSPLYLAVMIILFLYCSRLGSSQRFALLSFYLLLLGFYCPQSLALIRDMRVEGRGFNSRQWEDAKTVAYVRSLPKDIVLFSNEVEPLEFLTGRNVWPIPEVMDSVTGEQVVNIDQITASFKTTMQQPGRVLVIVSMVRYRPEMLPFKKLDLQLVRRFHDGSIYASLQNVDKIPFP